MPKKPKWVVLIQSDLSYWDEESEDVVSVDYEEYLKLSPTLKSEVDGDYEISVVRSSNKLGLSSWGWTSSDKIAISNGGEGIEQAVECANILCEALNAKP